MYLSFLVFCVATPYLEKTLDILAAYFFTQLEQLGTLQLLSFHETASLFIVIRLHVKGLSEAKEEEKCKELISPLFPGPSLHCLPLTTLVTSCATSGSLSSATTCQGALF